MEKIVLTIDTKLLQDPGIVALFKQLGIKHEVKVDTTQASSAVKILADKISTAFAKFGLIEQGFSRATNIVKKIGEAVIKPAAEIEQLRLRLVSLYGSTDRANQAFEKFRDVATRTPATLQQVVEAGASLKAFGMNAEETLDSVSDLAAYMGLDVVEAAQAVGRAFAGGVGAADILRERGVLELIKSFKGIDDLSRLTLPEFRQALIQTLQDPAAGIAGSADRIAKSYTGAMSNLEDSFTTLRAKIGEELTPALTTLANSLSNVIQGLTGTSSQTKIATREAEEQKIKFETLISTYTDLHNKINKTSVENDLYQETIKKLMEQYPNYFKNVDLEKGKWQDIASAIDKARISLTEYLSMQIRQAEVEKSQSKINEVLHKISSYTTKLEQLKGEMRAKGKKESDVYKIYLDDFDTYGQWIKTYQDNIDYYTKKEKELRAELEANIKFMEKYYGIVPPKTTSSGGDGGGKGSGGGGGGGGGNKNITKSPFQSLIEQMRQDLMTERELIEEEKKQREAIIYKEMPVPKKGKDVNAKKRAEALEMSNQIYLRKKQELDEKEAELEQKAEEAKMQAQTQYYEEVKFLDTGYYEWKKEQIKKEVQAMAISTEQQEQLLNQRLADLEKEKIAYENMPRQAILDQYNAEIERLANLKTIGALTYDELTAKMYYYAELIKETFGAESEEYANALEAMRSAQLHISETLAEQWRKDNKTFLDAWNTTTSSLVAGFDTAWNSIFESSLSGVERLNKIWDAMRDKFIDNIGQMASQYVQNKLTELAVELTVEKDKQAAILETMGIEKSALMVSIATAVKSAFAGLFEAISNVWKWWTKLIPPPYSVTAAIATGAAMISAFNALKKKLGFASGGFISGAGTSTSDSIPILASNGEYIINANAVRQPGVLNLLQQINALKSPILSPSPAYPQHFATGGYVNSTFPDLKELINEVKLLRVDIYKAQPTIINKAPNPIEIHKMNETGRKLYKGY